jgi:uncharacterized protein (DUF58 family)
VSETPRRSFPLVPRRRVAGIPFGEQRSLRRGPGSDVAGSREYAPGDPVSTIDWYASARLSSARDGDVFVVREKYAEEAPRVVVLCDRRPAMALYPPEFPWLSKPAAVSAVADAIVVSALAARGEIGYIDFAGSAGREGVPFWLPPRSRRRRWEVEERLGTLAFDAPEDNVERGLDYLARLRADLPSGSFVFVVSDFLSPPRLEAWLHARALRWDVVPVIVQDPVWEQSFPELRSVTVPFAEPGTGRVLTARVSASEARELRAVNEARLGRLLSELRGIGLDPVVVGTSDPLAIDREFLAWAELRRQGRRRGR